MTGRRLAVVWVAAALTLAGCASIPGETLPQHANLAGGATAPAAVAQPARNATPLDIVRGFVNANGDPSGQHAAARVYLAPTAQNTWNKGAAPAVVDIVDGTFSTEGPDFAGQDDATVVLDTHLVGTVGPDGAYQAATVDQSSDFKLTLHLHGQSAGQWRIVDPPAALVVTRSDFQRYYSLASVYFFDQTWDVLVPDLRYVVADPASGVVAQIVALLLDGPSASLTGAVQNAIPGGATLKTNVVVSEDGLITVNLSTLQDQPSTAKQLMVAQIVRSLQGYGSSVAVESEGQPLVPGHLTWRSSDLPNYQIYINPKATGLVVAHGKVLNLTDGNPIRGPAGDGTYNVVTAAESADGTQLATVTAEPDGGHVLRIGGLNAAEAQVKGITANLFTRPSWSPSDSAGDPSRSLWTVADGTVLRVVTTPQNSWAATPVDASALVPYGTITDLRLSRDGVHVAVVAGGNLLVGAVAMDQNAVSIRQVRVLQPSLTAVTRVDWLNQGQLVVATGQSGAPVQTVSVDGMTLDSYTSANLYTAVTDVAALDGQPVLAVTSAGLWQSTDLHLAWQPVTHAQPAAAIPFYPG
jgi:Lipoprotein LpqB beta-propeller domain/Sporulation and spore germination